MKTLALNPYKTYVYEIMKTKDIVVTEQVYYGGEKSESVPCGFVTEWHFDKPRTKRQNKNRKDRIKPTRSLTSKEDNRGPGANSMKL